MNRLMCAVLALVAMQIPSQVSAQQVTDGTVVKLGRWDTFGGELVSNGIVKSLLGDLGYKVEVSSLSPAPFYKALGQGDVDLWDGGTWPNHAAMFAAIKDTAVVLGDGTIIGGGVNAILIDKKTAEEHHITHLEQFSDPKIAKIFDTDGDGKADLYQCDFGWGCANIVDFYIKSLKLEPNVKSVQAKWDMLMADTVAKFQRGEPVMYYAWAPSWITHKLQPGRDVVWLQIDSKDLPAAMQDGTDVRGSSPGIAGCAGGSDPCEIGAPWNNKMIANKAFADAHPGVSKMLAEMKWSLETWSAWEDAINDGAKSDADFRRLADEWIASNKVTYDAWLKVGASK